MKRAIKVTTTEQQWKVLIFVPALIVFVFAMSKLVPFFGEGTSSTSNMWAAILAIAGGFMIECIWTFISGICYNLHSELED